MDRHNSKENAGKARNLQLQGQQQTKRISQGGGIRLRGIEHIRGRIDRQQQSKRKSGMHGTTWKKLHSNGQNKCGLKIEGVRKGERK